MNKTLAVIGLSVFAISQTGISAFAQFNVQNGDESVSIGPNGISVRKRGQNSQTVNITPGGIDIKDSTQRQHVNIRSNGPGRTVIINQADTAGKSTTTIRSNNSVNIDNKREAATIIDNGPNHDLVLNANNQTISYRCRGGDAVVNGYKSKINLHGKINDLVVNGHDNVIVCESVDEIVVNGHNNNVTYRHPAKPDVTDNGANNKVVSQ